MIKMDIKNLNSIIAKKVIDPNDLKVGDFVSRINFDGKRINNRYFVSLIKTDQSDQSNNNKKSVIKVRCYDFIEDKFVDFVGDELLNFLKPNCNDFYDYQFSTDKMEVDDYVTFIDPKPFQMVIKRDKEKTLFVITSCSIDKYGTKFVSLVDNNNNCLFNIPAAFLKVYDRKITSDKQIKINPIKGKKDMKIENNLKTSPFVPKESEDTKNLNFDFSINVNNKGIKFEFHDENHKLMSETSVDFNKDDLNNIGQVVGKYISNLIELNLELNKLNQDKRVKLN